MVDTLLPMCGIYETKLQILLEANDDFIKHILSVVSGNYTIDGTKTKDDCFFKFPLQEIQL